MNLNMEERPEKEEERYSIYAPPLFRFAEAAAAPHWEPKVPCGLVTPAH